MPNLEQLATHRFWQEHVPKFYEQYMSSAESNKPSLKLSTAAKDQIKIAVQKTEQRLRDEQKSVNMKKKIHLKFERKLNFGIFSFTRI